MNLVEIVNQQIPLSERICVQIVTELFQPFLMVSGAVPDFEFEHITLAAAGDDDVHASLLGHIRLLEVESPATEDRSEKGQKQQPPLPFQEPPVFPRIMLPHESLESLQNQSDIQSFLRTGNEAGKGWHMRYPIHLLLSELCEFRSLQKLKLSDEHIQKNVDKTFLMLISAPVNSLKADLQGQVVIPLIKLFFQT